MARPKTLAVPWRALAVATFALALALPFVGLWALASSAGRVQRNSLWEVRTLLALNELGTVERRVLEMESAARGFLLTGDERGLDHFPVAQVDLDRSMRALARLTADNPVQARRLADVAPLLQARVGSLTGLIQLRREGGLAAAAREVGNAEGTRQTAGILDLLAGMEAEEDRMVVVNSLGLDRGVLLFRRSLALGVCAVAVLCGLALLFFKWGLDERRKARETVERERQAAENAIQASNEQLRQSNRDLAQFASVASHDLQEPLRMVASFTELLARKYQGRLDAEADEYIGFAVDGARRMQRLIEDLLRFSRITSQGGPPARCAAGAALAQALLNLQGTIQETSAAITHDPLPEVDADASQLAMVFQNLVGNAIKFKGPSPPKIHISAVKEDGSWHFAVTDNGIGIDPKHHQRIFEIFQRLHTRAEYPGTGIGLALCKRIIERHGGRIWVVSGGAGTAFHFTLPSQGELP